MKVLVGCEFSGVVRDAFLARGHDAWSCDIIPTKTPGPHIVQDVRNVLDDGLDLAIFHPPCTYLSNAGIGYFNEAKYGERAVERKRLREIALQFFLALYNADIPHICVENPIGYVSRAFRKPDQIIHPYYFGEEQLKRTGLWLKGLPGLMYHKRGELFEPTATVYPSPVYIDRRRVNGRIKNRYFVDAYSSRTAQERSVTFGSIASAMADQWGEL